MLKFLNDHSEEWLLVLLMAAMSVLIAVQVFMRYVLNNSLTWSEELARYMFIWATYIGAAYGVKTKAHVGVTLLTDKFPEAFRHVFNLLSYLIFIVFAIFIAWNSYFMIMKILKLNQLSSSLHIPMAYVYMGPFIGFLLIIFRLCQHVYQEVRSMKGP